MKYIKTARELRLTETEAEKIMWSFLRNRKLNGLKFRRQHPIGPFVVDFYCAEHKLVIELDGEIHLNKDISFRDIEREKSLCSTGLEVLRIQNYEVINSINSVIYKIIRHTQK